MQRRMPRYFRDCFTGFRTSMSGLYPVGEALPASGYNVCSLFLASIFICFRYLYLSLLLITSHRHRGQRSRRNHNRGNRQASWTNGVPPAGVPVPASSPSPEPQAVHSPPPAASARQTHAHRLLGSQLPVCLFIFSVLFITFSNTLLVSLTPSGFACMSPAVFPLRLGMPAVRFLHANRFRGLPISMRCLHNGKADFPGGNSPLPMWTGTYVKHCKRTFLSHKHKRHY